MDTSDWKVVHTRDGGLSLRVPRDWEMESEGDEGEALLAASPRDEIDPIVVVTSEPSSWGSASDYKTGNVIRLQEGGGALRDFVDHGGGEWMVDGQAISWHSYSYVTGKGLAMRVVIFCAVSTETAYVVRCSVLAENWPRLEPTVMAIGGSIRLTGDR
jgi:hypothetical protein